MESEPGLFATVILDLSDARKSVIDQATGKYIVSSGLRVKNTEGSFDEML